MTVQPSSKVQDSPAVGSLADASSSAASGVAALARGLEILRCFSAREPTLSNGDIAVHTGLPKSTVSRLTKTLVELGYLRHDAPKRQYSVGPSVLALGYSALCNLRVADLARPHMQALADKTGALISLATRDRLSMLYIEACSSDSLLSLRMGRGVRMPMMTTSIGRAFLGSLPEGERHHITEMLRKKSVPAVTEDERVALRREVGRFEKDGYCLSLGDWNPSVNAAATPIRWTGGSDVIVLSVSGPSYLITEELLTERLITRMMQLAEHISKLLTSFEGV